MQLAPPGQSGSEGEQAVLESEAISSDDNPDALLSALSHTVEAVTATLTNPGQAAQLQVVNSGNPADRSGEVIHERYRLLRMLGKGGMGTVYIAQHVALAKTFAVKLLNPRYASRADIAERFLQEAKAVSMIDHENVVGVTDFGTADGSAFLVMEHLRGESLAALYKREAPLPWARVRHIMVQLCRALTAAHEVGVVHRDIKPDNILRTQKHDDLDFIKVLDFGLAKLQTGGGLRLTRTGMVLGTPEYMSPEQARGAPTDHRTDIYAAGIVMYVLLCGRPPFKAKNFAGMRNQHLLVAPEPPSVYTTEAGITDEMDAVVLRALAKEPSNRFESMAAMQAAIEAVGTGVGPVQLFERGDTHGDEVPPTLELVERNSMLSHSGRVTTRFAGRPRVRPPSPAAVEAAPSSDSSRARPLLGVTLVAVVAGVAAALAFGGVTGRKHEPARAPAEPEPPELEPVPSVAAPTEPPVVAAPLTALSGATAVLRFETNVPVRVLEAVDESMYAHGELADHIEVPRSDVELQLILRADGYLDKLVEVTPDRDHALIVELERAPEPEPASERTPKPKQSAPEPEPLKPAEPEPEPPKPEPEPPVDNSFAPGIVNPWDAAKG